MKNTIRLTYFYTVLCILTMVLPGCSGDNSNQDTSLRASQDTLSKKVDETGNVDSGAEGYNKGQGLSAKTRILTIDSSPVYWPEFLFWLKYIKKYYKKYHGYENITDWSAEQNGMPLNEFFLSCAVGYACKDRAIESKAKEIGISLTREDLAEIKEKREKNIRIYGSEPEYRRIVASMYVTENVFNYLTRIDYLGNYLFEYLYGVDGKNFSDRDVSTYVEDKDYMCVKYIFLSNKDSGGSAADSREREKNHGMLKGILERLESSDDPLTLFSAMMKKYGEDTEIFHFPDGRLMVPAAKGKGFVRAYRNLGENEYSGIVDSDKGCYLILRMPVSPDMKVDMAGNTLRYRAAYESFKNRVEEWSAELEVKYKDAYHKINVEKILG